MSSPRYLSGRWNRRRFGSLFIAFYYALTGFACVWYFRGTLRGSACNFWFRGVLPLPGAGTDRHVLPSTRHYFLERRTAGAAV